MNNPQEILAHCGKKFGSHWYHTQAGGGNISFKNSDHLFIKTSGSTLASMSDPGNTVEINLKEFNKIIGENRLNSDIQSSSATVENWLSSFKSTTGKTPSVESCFHSIGKPFVIHTHLVSAISVASSVKAEKIISEVEAISETQITWVPYYRPGWPLYRAIYERFFSNESGIFLLQNHGIVIYADTLEEAEFLFNNTQTALDSWLGRSSLPQALVDFDEITTDVFEVKSEHDILTYYANALTPDFVLHFGPGYQEVDSMNFEGSTGLYRFGDRLFIAGYGSSADGARDILRQQLQCCLDISKTGNIRFLSGNACQDLISWGPGKYSGR
ncbi:class II aldolase/adducin family protein [Myxococcota bacterium]|nr:class II aldolase/adducin family protein [Myxococcota bacterium]MBU1381226.1 class II aldolase/adducin family protein [Myxococcota bacterium]MBU1496926.1 class II aldolase/adducin family protein [Myxococcota bacterium]